MNIQLDEQDIKQAIVTYLGNRGINVVSEAVTITTVRAVTTADIDLDAVRETTCAPVFAEPYVGQAKATFPSNDGVLDKSEASLVEDSEPFEPDVIPQEGLDESPPAGTSLFATN